MSRYQHEIPDYLTTRHMVDAFALSWYKWHKYRKLGTIPPPDARVNGRPVWLSKRVRELMILIDALEGR